MTTYHSKIGLILVIPLTIIIAGTGILMAYEKIWVGLVLILLVAAFIAHMLLTTYYTVNNNTLRIKCGFFFDNTINIDTIREIKETKNPASSPAASLDRLLIIYKKNDNVIISPTDKCTFINHLVTINPTIKVTWQGNAKRSNDKI